jgi:uncharacterized membrane protein YhhN
VPVGAHTVLLIALAFGLAYTALCARPPSLFRTLIKVMSMALLALWAFLAEAPHWLAAGLGFSAVGDAFLAQKGERWLIPGMAAFFLAHAAYCVLFWQRGAGENVALSYAYTAPFLLGLLTLYCLRYLTPHLGRMRVPVYGYALVILAMGVMAMRLLPEGRMVAAGALMFMASDVILARELFVMKAGEGRWAPSISVWLLYFFGQVLIATGIAASDWVFG